MPALDRDPINAGHTFLRKLASNRDEIAAAIHKLPEAAQASPYRTLASVQQNPSVYYLPSSQERTCRLSARGDTILGLKKDIRRAATKGWVECDLRSSQFAILAATLQAPLSQAFIASGESLWRSLYRFLSGMDAEPPGEIKAVLKETIYSLCFGKGKKKLAKMLAARDMEHLLEHPVLVELLALRERWFEEIRAAKGASDVWGTWHALDETRDPRTNKSKRWAGAIAATVIQSIEMEIIAPIFEVAQKHGEADRFQIVLFQHDGATISFTAKGKREKRAMAKLKRAVEARAKELGVSTVLEFTQL